MALCGRAWMATTFASAMFLQQGASLATVSAHRDDLYLHAANSIVQSKSDVPEVGSLLEALGSEHPGSRIAVNATSKPRYELGDHGRISRISPDKPTFQVTWERNGLMSFISKDQWHRACRKLAGPPAFQIGDMMEALPGRQYTSTSGEDYYQPGDKCRVVALNSTHGSQLQVMWLRTNRSSWLSRESWPIYVKLVTDDARNSERHSANRSSGNDPQSVKDDMAWIERVKTFFNRNSWAKKESTRTVQKRCEGPVQIGTLMEALSTSNEFQRGKVGRLSSQWQEGFGVTWEDTGVSSAFTYENWHNSLMVVGEPLDLNEGDQVEALPDKTSATGGIEYYRPGDVGSVLEFYTTVDNVEIVRVNWNRTNKTSSHPGSRWPTYFKVLQSAATESTEAVKKENWQVGSLLMARASVEDVAPDGSIWYKPGSMGRVAYVSDDKEIVAVTWESSGFTSLVPLDSWRCSFHFVGEPPELRVGDLMQALPRSPVADGFSGKVLGRIVKVLRNEKGDELLSIKWGDAEKTSLIKKSMWPTSTVLITDSDTRGRLKSRPTLPAGGKNEETVSQQPANPLATLPSGQSETRAEVPPFPVLPTQDIASPPMQPPQEQPAQEIAPPPLQPPQELVPPPLQASAPAEVPTFDASSPPAEQPPVDLPLEAAGGEVAMPRTEGATNAADSTVTPDAMNANASQVQIGALMKALKSGGSGAWVPAEEDLGDWYKAGDLGRVSAINGYMFSVTWQNTGRTSGHRLDEYLKVMDFKGVPPALQVGDAVQSISKKPTVVNNISICSPGDHGHIAGFKVVSAGEVMDVTWDASGKNTTVPLSSWPTYIWLLATTTD